MFKFSFLILTLFISSLLGEIKIREDWAEIPPELPITQKHVVNKELTLKLHGNSKDKIKKSHHANIKNDPFYVWSGRTQSVWAVSLELKESVAVSGKQLSLNWRTKQSGGRVLYFLIQDGEGKWFIYNEGTGVAKNWNVASFKFDSGKWSSFDITTLKKGDKVDQLEIKSVKSIGFTDLTKGGASKASSRVDWLELVIKYSSPFSF